MTWSSPWTRERLPLRVASKVLGPCVHLRLARAAHSMATAEVLKHTVDRAASLGPVCTAQTILVDREMEASSVPPDKAFVVLSTATAGVLTHTVGKGANQELVEGKESSLQASTSPAVTLV
jgi:hypothetical protein